MLRSIFAGALFGVLLSLGLLSFAIDGDNPHPLDYSVREYVFLLGVAVLGGVVGWYGRVKAGVAAPFSIAHLVGELSTSAFAGLMAFWLCQWANAPELLTVSIVGIAGHMGARFLFAVEIWLRRRFQVEVA